MTITPRPRLLLAALAGIATVLLAGCGGSDSASSDSAAGGGDAPAVTSSAADGASDAPAEDTGDAAGSAPDPCSLVTAEALSSAYGVTFGEGATSDSDVAAERGFRACTWKDDSETKSFVLQTVASGDPLGQTASELFDQSVELYPDSTPGTVGDKSLLLPQGGGFLAVSGDVFVQGNAIIFGGETPERVDHDPADRGRRPLTPATGR